jgi:hypothetical protein
MSLRLHLEGAGDWPLAFVLGDRSEAFVERSCCKKYMRQNEQYTKGFSIRSGVHMRLQEMEMHREAAVSTRYPAAPAMPGKAQKAHAPGRA